MERFVLSALVQNHAGVLSRISGLFSRRGFNIDSLTVGETMDPAVSRMTIAVRGDEEILLQIQRQLGKLEDVIAVRCLEQDSGVMRELALVKVSVSAEHRADVINIAKIFRARVVDVAAHSLIVEVTGNREKIDGLIGLLEPYGIPEFARTGITALQRGEETLPLPATEEYDYRLYAKIS